MKTNEKQNPEEKVKPLSDEVVLLMDQPKQSPSKYPIPIDPNTPQIQDKTQTTTTTTRTLRRLQFSKPKSRFVEFNQPYKSIPIIESHDPNSTQKDEDEDEEEELLKEEEEEEEKLTNKNRKKKRKVRWRAIAEWSALVVLMTCLVTSRTVHWWKHEELWGLAIWKWYLMALVILCGRLVSGWLVGLLTFIIERHFLLREKVLYFVYGLRNSVRNCIWLGLVLLAWYVMFDPEVLDSTHHHRMVWRVWRALIAVTIGAVIWLVKIILVKVLASSFHVATFFDRMKESVFHYVVLEKLSRPPIDQDPKEMIMGRAKAMPPSLTKQIGSRRIDMEKLRRLSREKPSAYSVKRLVSHVRSSGLSTISTIVDETMQEFKEREEEINSEWEARSCAQRIFKNVAKAGAKYIEKGDLLRFLEEEEVHTIFPLFEGAMETGKINKSAFKNWMVRAYLERKALAHSLNDTKTAVQQLHKLASAIVIVIIIVMSLLVMGVATTKVVFVVTSQLVLAGFMFGNTCKTMFESIIFVFAMHPFDVGDRCVIDGVQMVVEEMNILTTVFLRFDNEKIYYPNSVLLTKPISNFKRSPEMGDNIKFGIDASTSAETFTAMKDAIRKYIESKPKHWQSKHSVIVEEIENLNKMKVTLYVIHTINHQNIAEKNNRRSELVFELKKIFEILGIKYHLLSQEVHLSQVFMPSAARVPAPAPAMII
eukprot:TRINITY_DN38996_c0_g1_i2.p1 TRINITY_DN38996_c0_g1~~TRINITY_DN38996_c0_g1_i2.p1  ORF type:complete len:725 (-),score=102.61 TRINITY_DN38996_c0_g1_i2:459-2576(-)